MAKKQVLNEQKAAKSQEYIEDSSSESDSDQASNQSKDGKHSQTSQNPDSNNESDTESTDQSESQMVNATANSGTTTATKRPSDTSKSSQEPFKKKLKKFTGVQRVAHDSFRPPTGYSTIELGDTDFVSQSASMFSNLGGKQVWHITAPASLPITLIEKLDVTAALQGEPILHHAGTSYNMLATPSMGETLLLPKGADSIYSKTRVGVSQNFHLRETPHQKPALNGTTTSKAVESPTKRSDNDESQQLQFSAAKKGVRKPKREQPSGLLMRYQPYGSAQKSERPYRLQHPETDEAEKDTHETSGNIVVPPSLEDEASQVDIATTPKSSKHSKKLKHDGVAQDGNSPRGDGMDVDRRVNGNSTPESKVKPRIKHESAKKRKKHSQE